MFIAAMNASTTNTFLHFVLFFSTFLITFRLSSTSNNNVDVKNSNKTSIKIEAFGNLNSSLIISISGVSRSMYEIRLPNGVVGPESIAFDCNGRGPYVGVSDGTILKWQGSAFGWSQFAVMSPYKERRRNGCDGYADLNLEPLCGRPLGVKFNPTTCDLYIADAYFGLLRVGSNGGLAQPVATSAEGVPFRFTNALDIDPNTGIVYFTDTSTIFQRRVWQLSIASGDRSGRLLQYDPRTEKVTVLLRDLGFPNGVALSKDSSFVLVAESSTWKIYKLWLKGSNGYKLEEFAQLKRSPDNIKRNENGEFWVAQNSGREILNENMASTQNGFGELVFDDTVGIKFDEEGNVIQMIDGNGGSVLDSVSEVVEQHDGNLWTGSAIKSYVGLIGCC